MMTFKELTHELELYALKDPNNNRDDYHITCVTNSTGEVNVFATQWRKYFDVTVGLTFFKPDEMMDRKHIKTIAKSFEELCTIAAQLDYTRYAKTRNEREKALAFRKNVLTSVQRLKAWLEALSEQSNIL